MSALNLTDSERIQIAEILGRRANDVASFLGDMKRKASGDLEYPPGSVEMALTREMERLRRLRDKVKLPEPTEEE